MNSKTWTRIITLALFAVIAVPFHLAAQDKPDHRNMYHHYKLIDMGTFGGPQSYLYAPFIVSAGVVNNRGTLVGWADTTTVDPLCFLDYPDCYVAHAFQWQNGVRTDLGVLESGPSSETTWISASGLIAGASENGQIDPLSGSPELHAVLWVNGGINDLGTLPEGGYESSTSAVNSRGQVAGYAANTIPDPNSMWTGLGYQTRAFLWDNQKGLQDLGTLPGGTNAAAGFINEQGQVAGWSYTNSAPSTICAGEFGFALTTASFIWDKQNGMRDLGGLGGTCTLAQDVNGEGQIIGGSALTGDPTFHPFVWDAATGITDLLGASDGKYGFAESINSVGEVVGGACGSSCHALLWRKRGGQWQKLDLGHDAFSISINALEQVIGNFGTTSSSPFLWEDGGPMVDLNTLVPPNSGIQLVEAVQINDRGEIAVNGTDTSGNNHAVLLIPCDDNHSGVDSCDYSLVYATAAAQVHPPQVAQTRSGATQNGVPLTLNNRLRSGMVRRYDTRGGINGSER